MLSNTKRKEVDFCSAISTAGGLRNRLSQTKNEFHHRGSLDFRNSPPLGGGAYKEEGPEFMRSLVAKQEARVRAHDLGTVHDWCLVTGLRSLCGRTFCGGFRAVDYLPRRK